MHNILSESADFYRTSDRKKWLTFSNTWRIYCSYDVRSCK